MFDDVLNQIDDAANQVGSTFNNIWGMRQNVREVLSPSQTIDPRGGPVQGQDTFMGGYTKKQVFGNLTGLALLAGGTWLAVKLWKGA